MKYCLDDGGGFFKICANYVVEKKDLPTFKRAAKHKKARWRSRFKDSSVKHSLIIAIVQDIPEVKPTLELIFIKLHFILLNNYSVFKLIQRVRIVQVLD